MFFSIEFTLFTSTIDREYEKSLKNVLSKEMYERHSFWEVSVDDRKTLTEEQFVTQST
jgi:hypothetical protein